MAADFGRLDVLVNNAAILYDTWQHAVDADLAQVREAPFEVVNAHAVQGPAEGYSHCLSCPGEVLMTGTVYRAIENMLQSELTTQSAVRGRSGAPSPAALQPSQATSQTTDRATW